MYLTSFILDMKIHTNQINFTKSFISAFEFNMTYYHLMISFGIKMLNRKLERTHYKGTS